MNEDLEWRARDAFGKRFDTDPDGVAFAPGRVNLIGEHVDYNDGLVLPMPIAQGTAVAWSRTDGTRIEAFAADLDRFDEFEPADIERPETADWRSYLRGMAAHRQGALPGLQLAIAGDLPRGSGLSSSASLCIALGRAFAAADGVGSDAVELARQAQATEHDFAGVACGIMDQMAIAAGEPGHAMLLDCRDLGFRRFRIPAEWAVLVVDSGVTRGLVDGEYNARRRQCEAAAGMLGVASLRDVARERLDDADLPEPELRRARHVVSEIGRVREACAALEQDDLRRFGAILREGHASLRDLFEVSVPQVDRLVERLDGLVGEEGGARMTGAGFGGSVVVVCRPDRAGAIADEWGPAAVRVA